jgi:hypothetical protein
MDSKGNGNGGRFFLNLHEEVTGRITTDRDGNTVGFGDYEYKHRRQARRAAKALATKRGITYRQEKEYTEYNPAAQIVTAPVTV